MTTDINGPGSIYIAGVNDASDAPCLSSKYFCEFNKKFKLTLKKLAGSAGKRLMK